MSNLTITSINRLPKQEKRAIYARLIPAQLVERFGISPDLRDPTGRDLLLLNCASGSTATEIELHHQIDFPDPILYGHLADTLYGQLHILLYVLNDPTAPRFDIDRLPDGTPTYFGTQHRNLEAELAAMQAGLAPGQLRRGLRLLGTAISTFEYFAASLGHNMFFTEPLFYHNAIVFERYGFSYVKGRKLMMRIQQGFSEGGDLLSRLDSSTPFRMPEAAKSIRLRSWAIHDNLLGEPFMDMTMYKVVGKPANINTCSDCEW
jgi:hypothetical protein